MIESSYDERERETLLDVARRSLECGLKDGRALAVDVTAYPPKLRERRATFITLKKHGELRGCIGSLEAIRPLVDDVADRAFAAGFRDPRFGPLVEEELAELEIEISILTPIEPFPVTSEADLLAKLRPGVDGLILEAGSRRGTFLPAVWENLPEPRDFLLHLKRKAQLPDDYWSPDIRFSRYAAEKISDRPTRTAR